MIDDLRNAYRLKELLDCLNISKSSYFYQPVPALSLDAGGCLARVGFPLGHLKSCAAKQRGKPLPKQKCNAVILPLPPWFATPDTHASVTTASQRQRAKTMDSTLSRSLQP